MCSFASGKRSTRSVARWPGFGRVDRTVEPLAGPQRVAAAAGVVRAGQPGDEAVERHRAADAEALRHVAVEALQAVQHLVGLHAFGDHLHAQVVAEVDDGPHDHFVLLVEQHVGHEAAVDLQLAHRQVAQVAERRVAGAEVVDRQPDAVLVEPVDGGAGAGCVDEQRRLGDLQRQQRRVDVVAVEVAHHPFGQQLVEQVVRGEVDGQAEVMAEAAQALQLRRPTPRAPGR